VWCKKNSTNTYTEGGLGITFPTGYRPPRDHVFNIQAIEIGVSSGYIKVTQEGVLSIAFSGTASSFSEGWTVCWVTS
jgi:hypothetical protein